MTTPADLGRGSSGEAVRDLQQRLGALGLDSAPDEPGRFGEGTETAVRQFQDRRGLRVDGVCGAETWGALVESGYALGDRLLYERRPMLRGDDVTELQGRLNALGFDAGREDGILGPETAQALGEFQRNAGLAADGIGGPATVDALRRLGGLAAGSVATVREREELRRGPRDLAGRRVFVAAAPGLESLGAVVVGGLLRAGAHALLDAAADESMVAADANRFEADLFLGIRPGDSSACRCSYFATPTYRSETGYRLACAVQEETGSALGLEPAEPCGRAYGLLRETRMAAVVVEPVAIGDVRGMRRLVANVAAVGAAIVDGLRRGLEQPPDDPEREMPARAPLEPGRSS